MCPTLEEEASGWFSQECNLTFSFGLKKIQEYSSKQVEKQSTNKNIQVYDEQILHNTDESSAGRLALCAAPDTEKQTDALSVELLLLLTFSLVLTLSLSHPLSLYLHLAAPDLFPSPLEVLIT